MIFANLKFWKLASAQECVVLTESAILTKAFRRKSTVKADRQKLEFNLKFALYLPSSTGSSD